MGARAVEAGELHPYLPEGTQVVTYGLTGEEVVDKVLRWWDESVTKAN